MAKSPARTAAQRRELLERYARSGLSRRAFCAQEGIGESTLGAWQRRLRNAASSTPEATQERATPPAPCWDVELDLGDGLCLRVRRRPC